MSTQHCGLTAPVESTTEYLFGAVHSTVKNKTKEAVLSHVNHLDCFNSHKKEVKLCRLTFELEGELVRVVEGEHLLVSRLLVSVEDELRGENEHRKASFHQLRLSMLLLLLHWLQLSSDPAPSTLCPSPPHARLC